MSTSRPIPLSLIKPSSKQLAPRPKGFAPYRPTVRTKATMARILALYEQMRAVDALPLGPRQVGYRLKELYPGDYAKADFPALGEAVKRLGQAGKLEFAWIADAASATYQPGGWASLDDYIENVPDFHRRDRRAGQPTVIEVYSEAKETLGLIRRVAAERGVTVYSASGSGGPNLAHGVAQRAVTRAVDHGQSTLFFGICDFDKAGMKNILRPHVEHLSAFLYGTHPANDLVVAAAPQGNEDAELLTISEAGARAVFRHLALTPQMALDLVDDQDDKDAIGDYIDSGDDLWERDLDLLEGVQKIELEALDPAALRDLVVGALDATLDGTTLKRIGDEEEDERDRLRQFLGGFPATAGRSA